MVQSSHSLHGDHRGNLLGGRTWLLAPQPAALGIAFAPGLVGFLDGEHGKVSIRNLVLPMPDLLDVGSVIHRVRTNVLICTLKRCILNLLSICFAIELVAVPCGDHFVQVCVLAS
jgi:hypothetical protein